MTINELENFRVGGDAGMGQIREGGQHGLALTQIA